MFIDAHAHAYRKAPVYGPKGTRKWVSPEKLIEFYDRHNIEKGVLMPLLGPEFYPPQTNEDILEAAERFPGRFIPFCNVHPYAMNYSVHAPLEILLEQYKALGCKGVGEVTFNLSFFDPYMQNFFRAVEKCSLPLTFHLAHRLGGSYGIYDEAGLPGLAETLQNYPKLRMLGHSQTFWAEIGELDCVHDRAGYPEGKVREGAVPRLMRRFPNLYGDLSAGSGANALMRDEEYAIGFLMEFQDRLCFGMDACLEPSDENAKLAYFLLRLRDENKIPEEVFRKVACENIAKLLDI